jgi:radical SAM superfamily enzyme YgiQ (UPF0313 family)
MVNMSSNPTPLRFTLLNPPGLQGEIYRKELWRCGIKSKVRADCLPQIGLAYIAAVIEQTGMRAQIVDGIAEDLSLEETLTRITAFQSDAVILLTTTASYTNDTQVSRAVRELLPGVTLGLTGSHANALPEESLRDFGADFVLLGEAEETLRELLGRWEGSWETIAGLCVRNGASHIRTPARAEITDLDSLPFPARHLLPAYYSPFDHRTPYTSIIPSRGCPYSCTYCRAGSVWKDTRFRSPANVVKEIRHIVEQEGIEEIFFYSDTFTIHKRWVMELCDLLVKGGLRVRWTCNSRVDTIDEEMVAAMRTAGCHLMAFGTESGDQAILDGVKKLATVEDAERAVRMTKAGGIECLTFFMLGLPGETWETIETSIRFALRLDPDYLVVYIATPYPGTEFYDLAKSQGWLVDEDWQRYLSTESAVIRTKHLSPEDLLKARRVFYRRFYFRPSYMWRRLKSIRSLDDVAFNAKRVASMLGYFSRRFDKQASTASERG